MDWQASIEDRGAVITFRGLTPHASASAPLSDIERCIEPGQTWDGRSFEDWLAFLQARGGSVTIRINRDGSVLECRG